MIAKNGKRVTYTNPKKKELQDKLKSAREKGADKLKPKERDELLTALLAV